MEDESVHIGIDLGTTNSCVAYFENGQIIMIPNDTTSPDVEPVSFGRRLRSAVPKGLDVGKNIIPSRVKVGDVEFYSVKRFLGVTIEDKYTEKDVMNVRDAYAVEFDDYNQPIMIASDVASGVDLRFTPADLTRMLLQMLISKTEQFIAPRTIADAVITVPAYFGELQRRIIRSVASQVGLKLLNIVNEPTAAALAYRYELGMLEVDRVVLVFDLGGGTFDVSIVQFRTNGLVDVIAKTGKRHLGGDDVDQTLVDHFRLQLEPHRIPWTRDLNRELRTLCCRLKCMLSDADKARVVFSVDGKPYALEITRGIFDRICQPFLSKCRDTLQQLLDDATKCSTFVKSSINEVVLVGGSSKISAIRKIIQTVLGSRVAINGNVNPDEVVARGAAVRAAMLSKTIQSLHLLDVTSLGLGFKLHTGRFVHVIPACEYIPTAVTTRIFSHPNGVGLDLFILEGLSEDASKAHMIKKINVVLREKSSVPGKGVPLDLIFKVSACGILTVTVRDLNGVVLNDETVDGSRRANPALIESHRQRDKNRVEEERDAKIMFERHALVEHVHQKFNEINDEECLAELHKFWSGLNTLDGLNSIRAIKKARHDFDRQVVLITLGEE